MAVKVKFTAFDKTIKVLIDTRLSKEARSLRFAQFARLKINEADEQNRRALGAIPPKTVTVDGKLGAPLESVDPDHGIIVAQWRLVGDVIAWIANTLKQRSPVLSGRYRSYHVLYADGVEVLASEDPPIAKEYIFLNPLPYSRKIEIGKTESGRDFVIQVPNRIYERTAEDAAKRFGNIAKIRFTYQAAVGGQIAKRHKAGDRVPAIVITVQ